MNKNGRGEGLGMRLAFSVRPARYAGSCSCDKQLPTSLYYTWCVCPSCRGKKRKQSEGIHDYASFLAQAPPRLLFMTPKQFHAMSGRQKVETWGSAQLKGLEVLSNLRCLSKGWRLGRYSTPCSQVLPLWNMNTPA